MKVNITKSKFVALWSGHLGKDVVSKLYDSLLFAFRTGVRVRVNVGADWVSDIYICKVVALYSNGTFAVYVPREDKYINLCPLDVYGVFFGVTLRR